MMILGDVSFSDIVAALAPAQKTLAREINPNIFAVPEFRSKLAAGNHFLRSVMKEKKLFVMGSEHELKKLAENSWLVQHTASREEIANLLAISDRDLAACQVKQLPSDWRFAIAYNAAAPSRNGCISSGRLSRQPRQPSLSSDSSAGIYDWAHPEVY